MERYSIADELEEIKKSDMLYYLNSDGFDKRESLENALPRSEQRIGMNDDCEAILNNCANQQMLKAVEKYIVRSKKISEREGVAFALRFGLMDGKPRTLKECGRLMGIFDSTVGEHVRKVAIYLSYYNPVREAYFGTDELQSYEEARFYISRFNPFTNFPEKKENYKNYGDILKNYINFALTTNKKADFKELESILYDYEAKTLNRVK